MKLDKKTKAVVFVLATVLPIALTPASSQAVTVKAPPIAAGPQKSLIGIKFKPVYDRTPEGLVNLLASAGFEGKALKIAWAVVMKESHGNPLSHNLNAHTGDNSYGLFQVNMRGDLGPSRRNWFKIASNDELFDPEVNAKVGYILSDGGKDFTRWNVGQNPQNNYVVRNWLEEFPTSF